MSGWDNDGEGEQDGTVMDFATDAVEPQRAFEPLPPGKYPVTIRKVSVKPTKNGTGKRANFELVVAESDPHKGRVIFHGINVINANADAQTIGRRELAGLLSALGMAGERDLAKTIGLDVYATIKVRQASDGYEASNEVKGYSPIGGAVPSTTTVPAAAPSAPATPGTRKPPAFVR